MSNLSKVLISFSLLAASITANAQKIKVSGVVTDETGETVIGATIMEKGTKTGTVTDFDGNFMLDADQGATLVISYVGYKTVEVKVQPNMKIKLAELANNLNEVVVTGYTTQKKADLTGSISVVSTKNLKSSSDTDPMLSLIHI